MNGQKMAKQGLYDPEFEHDSCGVGFVVNVKGKKSRQIIDQGLQILVNLSHRGACGCEANTGDGAGILMQIPHGFLKKTCEKKKIPLPDAGQYGVGMAYLPRDTKERAGCEKNFQKVVRDEGLKCLGWRTLPTDNSSLGERASR